MLIALSQAQLESIATVSGDGCMVVDRVALASVLEAQLGTGPLAIAIMSFTYGQHDDGMPEPDKRTVKGICWVPLGGNRCHKWSFRSDGLALSTTDEHEQPCPISDDPELISRATLAVAEGYPGSLVSERTARIELSPRRGKVKQVRVAVVHDPRISRPEDVLVPLEFLAFKAGALGLAMVQPVEGGQALLRRFGL